MVPDIPLSHCCSPIRIHFLNLGITSKQKQFPPFTVRVRCLSKYNVSSNHNMFRLSAKPASIAAVEGADNLKMQGESTRALERDHTATWRTISATSPSINTYPCNITIL